MVMEELDQLVKLAQGVPTGTGSGKSGLVHKVHAVAHAEKFVNKSWPSTVKMLNSSFTWTGDQSTEKGFPKAKCKIPELFGPWTIDVDNVEFDYSDYDEGDAGPAENGDMLDMDVDFDFDEEENGVLRRNGGDGGESDARSDGGDGIDRDASDDDPDYQVVDPEDRLLLDLTHSVHLAGLLHICHNCVEGLKGVLQHWLTYVESLKVICRLVTVKRFKHRLLQTCFSTAPWVVFEEDIRKAIMKPYDSRWATILHATFSLLEIKAPLRGGWNAAAYQAGNVAGPHDPAGDEFTVNIVKADAGISSNLFWGYACMLDIIAYFP